MPGKEVGEIQIDVTELRNTQSFLKSFRQDALPLFMMG
jgi:hypothetical protein